MNPQLFARVKEILLTLRTIPEDERAAYLEAACGEDPELRRNVDYLLDPHVECPDVLRTGAMGDLLRRATDPGLVLAGTRRMPESVGPYRILGILGEGGMGIVYRARQTQPIQREVALKLVKRGMDTDRFIARFEAERQTLARMDHPNIAKVLDAGADVRGHPYFVMELVRGVPITEYCQSNDPGTKEILDLFLSVCRAVQHAHQQGIIHRDLKPSNVLVTLQDDRPAAKIIDFGIARAMEDPSAGRTLLTQEGQIIGTPEYMSPEQTLGDPSRVDMRADVYSLGVILYELLAGDLPYDTRQTSIVERARVIREEPPRPLRGRNTQTREIRRDLEIIVFKAMEKDPDQRYYSAAALADDIHRYLTSQPILAHRPSTIYQVRKLVARHRVSFAFVVTVFVLLIAFGVTMVFMFTEQRRARTVAETETRKAEQINEFMQGMLSSSHPRNEGKDVTVREVLNEAAGEVGSTLVGQPEVEAAVRQTLAVTYTAMDMYDEADAQLDSARAVLRPVFGERYPQVASIMDDQTYILWRRGQYAEAESLARIALSIHDEFKDDQKGALVSMNNLGSFLLEQAKYSEAEPILRETVARRKEVYGPEHDEVAISLNQLANVHYRLGNYEESESLVRESLEIRRKLAGDKRDVAVAQSLQNLSVLHRVQGEYGDAEPLLREAIGIYIDLLGEEHVEVATARGNHAALLEELGDFDGAEKLYRMSLETRRKTLGNDHPSTAWSLIYLGRVRAVKGDPAEAEVCINEALGIFQDLGGEEHPGTLAGLNLRAAVFGANGERALAETTYCRVLETLKRLHGEEDLSVAGTQNGLALLCRENGEIERAEDLGRQSLAIREKKLGDSHPTVASSRCDLAIILLIERRANEAEPLLRQCTEVLQERLGDQHWQTALAFHSLGWCLAQQNRREEAEPYLAASLPVLRRPASTPAAVRRQVLDRSAEIYEQWGEPALAAECRKELAEASK